MQMEDEELIRLRALDYLAKRISQKTVKLPDFSINPTQNQIIFYLTYYKNKEMYQKDLCDLLKLQKSSVTESLDYLEKNGVISRIVNKDDNRKKQIVLTEKAKQVVNSIDESYRQINKTAVKDISKEELRTFNEVLAKMSSNISSMI